VRGSGKDGESGERVDEGKGVVSENVVQAEVCRLRGRGAVLWETGEGFDLYASELGVGVAGRGAGGGVTSSAGKACSM